MAGLVEAANFSRRFSGLNGVTPLNATRPDIIRSLLTVGYPSRRAAVKVVGPWRERMLVAMSTGYLDPSLNTTLYFRRLEQTEKVGVSFLLGEAFTHWYAQDRMNIEYLVHVAGLETCRWVAPSRSSRPKRGASAPSPKSRPDFIGVRRNERHVFESKGRIRSPSASTLSKALGQVSALRSINGKRPTTRCVSFFMLKATGTEAKVLDPPADADGIGVVFDELDALAKAYSFFLDGQTVSLFDQVGEGYVGREIEKDVFFGVDKRILAAMTERPRSASARRHRVDEIFGILSDRVQAYQGRRDAIASPGPDGTILIDRRDPHIRRRQTS
jgi:hypothetical protein